MKPGLRNAMLTTLVAIVAAVAGCATPGGVTDRDQRCHGAGMDRATCLEVAAQLCRSGFDIFEKEAPDESGVMRRGQYFRCKP